MVSDGQLPTDRVHVLSTGGMLDQARRTTAKRVLVATEIGMLHQLRKANSTTAFEPVNSKASCRFMKMTTPLKLLRALREGRDEVVVDPEVAARARAAISGSTVISSRPSRSARSSFSGVDIFR
jgi:quinolinate synthase